MGMQLARGSAAASSSSLQHGGLRACTRLNLAGNEISGAGVARLAECLRGDGVACPMPALRQICIGFNPALQEEEAYSRAKRRLEEAMPGLQAREVDESEHWILL